MIGLENKKGTTIGAKFALPYAIISMVSIEEEFLFPFLKNLGCGGGT